MRRIFLNSVRLQGKETAHAYLQKRFRMPEYTGHNLDALYDVLSSLGQETVLYLMKTESADAYGERIIDTMLEAADANPRLQVIRLS